MNNPKYISDDDNDHKCRAFAQNKFGFQRFIDGQWPTAGKTKQHDYFKNTKCGCHNYFFRKNNLNLKSKIYNILVLLPLNYLK
jgi:hypothetical protein